MQAQQQGDHAADARVVRLVGDVARGETIEQRRRGARVVGVEEVHRHALVFIEVGATFAGVDQSEEKLGHLGGVLLIGEGGESELQQPHRVGDVVVEEIVRIVLPGLARRFHQRVDEPHALG